MVAFRFTATLSLLLLGLAPGASAHMGQDLGHAPPPFTSAGKTFVPVDFTYVELDLHFDVASRKAVGKSRIEFFSRDAGHPLLDLVPAATAATLNGQSLGGLGTVKSPDGTATFRYADAAVGAFSHNLLEIEYGLPASEITWSSSGVSIGFFMDDISGERGFLEQYAPSNLEFDQFQMTARVRLTGASNTHRLFTNGRVSGSAGDWQVEFPAYFTTSSFYLHLTERAVSVETGTFRGQDRNVPVTVYSTSASLASTGLSRTLTILTELERTYGPYAHDSVTVYVTPSGGGMEHCGATMTSLGALGHELTHSWFARGVMPANGNAGWIDEAIASWRDNGYPTAGGTPNRPPVNLGAHSVYRRHTPMAAYSDGARLMSEFDYLFRGSLGGLKPVLKALFGAHRQETITTPEFRGFLERVSGADLEKVFDRYVFGKNVRRRFFRHLFEFLGGGGSEGPPPLTTRHPRRYTPQEREAYR